MRAQYQEKAFLEKIKASPDFVSWVLGKTKFKGSDVSLKLGRSDNPWYQSKTSGMQSETDILLVFERRDISERFALHIENKRLKDNFRPNQPELYHERAADWMNVPKWGSYSDFEVILLAPRAFYDKNKNKSDIFHRYISHEELSEFLPEFSMT